MTEAQFAGWVAELAVFFNWSAYHTFDSRRSAHGFPDWCMVRDDRLVFAELKVGRREPTMNQKLWLTRLAAVPNVEVYVWWPENRDQIERVLR